MISFRFVFLFNSYFFIYKELFVCQKQFNCIPDVLVTDEISTIMFAKLRFVLYIFFFCLHIIQEHLPWLEACVCRKLQHWCFPVNIAKFFKTFFSQNTSGDCFCLDGHSRYLFLSLDLFILPLPNSQGPWFIFLTIGIKCHVKCCEQCASIQNETNSLTKKTDPGTFLLCLFYRYTLP